LKSLLNFIDELSKCLNFLFEVKEAKATISIKFDASNFNLGESYYSNGGNISNINKNENSLKLINLNTEEEIDLEDLKVMTPRSFGKKRVSFYDNKYENKIDSHKD
jgi:hypothetical protein